jgi:hypothetical protein
MSGEISARALSAMVSAPGIDPRVWIAKAVVTDVGLDPTQGVFVDLLVQPEGVSDTAYLGSSYAGASFGEYESIEIGDTLIVAYPNGDPNAGPVIISRYWNSGDVPPAQIADQADPTTTTKDRVTVVKPGQKWKVFTSANGDGLEFSVGGDGSIILETLGSGKVQLGGRLALQPGVLGDTLTNYLTQLIGVLAGLTLPVSGAVAGPPAGGTIPTLPTITSTKVEIAP